MKKIFIPILCVCICLAACKKSDTNTVKDNIIGKWKLVSTATDDNNNGVQDASEVMADSTNTYFTFNSDGTGTSTDSTALTFKWALTNNNTYLQITTSWNFVDNEHIDALTSTTGTLRDTTFGQTSWSNYVKQ